MRLPGTRHIGLKFISIVLAALLWLLVSGERTVERAVRIPLELENLPEELEVVGVPEAVDVRVRGSSGVLARVAPGDLVAVVDVGSARAGQRLFHLVNADVRAPFGIDVVQVSPSNLSMMFEPSASRTVPVRPDVEGDPAPGFLVNGVTTVPPTVEVIGPATAVSNVTEAITEPVSVEGASAPVTEVVTVGVPDPSVRLKTPQSARITVSIAARGN
jgi:YbbR domain-containing protein